LIEEPRSPPEGSSCQMGMRFESECAHSVDFLYAQSHGELGLPLCPSFFRRLTHSRSWTSTAAFWRQLRERSSGSKLSRCAYLVFSVASKHLKTSRSGDLWSENQVTFTRHTYLTPTTRSLDIDAPCGLGYWLPTVTLASNDGYRTYRFTIGR
jgi:hypothetical protein